MVFGMGQMHCPETQASPSGHLVPHAPQLAASVSGFVQRPPHVMVADGHMQNDPTHIPPAGQRRPHWPQLPGSDVRSAHLLPHIVPVVQTHWPPIQAELAVHLAPHEPQLLVLELRSTHWLPQVTNPVGHVVVVVVGLVVVVSVVDDPVWAFAVKGRWTLPLREMTTPFMV
jgi:hypothetical protein